ncbi:MAG: glycosyltransferase family 4 protein [Ignavibacteria bacterium]
MKIRLAHIVTNFALGGAQDYIITILKNLDPNKYELYVFGKMDGERLVEFNKLNFVNYSDVPSLSRDIFPLKDIVAIIQVFKLCKKFNIDIIHTHSSKAGVVGRIGARIAGVKGILHTIHGFSFHDFMTKKRKFIFILLERFMSFFTDALLLVSNKEKEIAINLKLRPRKFIKTIYNGVDFLPFNNNINRNELRNSVGFQTSDFIIGFSGRFSQQKALHILIEAFSKINLELPSSRLLLVGDGILKDKLIQQAAQLNVSDKILMTGFQSNVVPYYKIMDVFVMTSLWEGLSRSLVEAMYAKLPVIATNVGGTSDAVRTDETGWLIEANNVNQVVSSVRDAYLNPEKREEMGEKAYHWARESFDIHKNVSQISMLYEKIYSEPSKYDK